MSMMVLKQLEKNQGVGKMKEVCIKKRVYEISAEELAKKLGIKGKIKGVDSFDYELGEESKLIKIEMV